MKIGTRVKGIPGDECCLSGVVVGNGWMEDKPILLVRLDEGGYIDNKRTYCYVSTIVAIPENLEIVSDPSDNVGKSIGERKRMGLSPNGMATDF